MQKYIVKPDINMYPGIKVTKETELMYDNENVHQELKDMVFRSVTAVNGDNYESVYDTTIYLKEGDLLVYDGEGRGYIKPVEPLVTVAEAIEELSCIKDL